VHKLAPPRTLVRVASFAVGAALSLLLQAGGGWWMIAGLPADHAGRRANPGTGCAQPRHAAGDTAQTRL